MSERFFRESPPTAPVRAVVLLLPGGRVHGQGPPRRLGLAPQRMATFHRALSGAGRELGLHAAVVRYRATGWNGGNPVLDADGAIDDIVARLPGVPICLVGHSMGGRVAFRIAGREPVVAICGLAPWLPDGEPVRQLAGRTVLIAQGDRDRSTPAAGSLAYARHAVHHAERLARFELVGAGHKLIARSRLWHDLTCRFVLGALGLTPMPADLVSAFALEPETRIRLPL